MNSQLLDNTLGQLATCIPGATQLFHELNLDFCCGGQQSLRQAAVEHGLDVEQLVNRLATLEQQNNNEDYHDWRNSQQSELIDHILQRYHDVHREQLPELIRLAIRVKQVHGHRADCPQELVEQLQQMYDDLENHMRKEEMILFPMINRGQGAMAGGPISVMRFEHDQHGNELAKVTQMTNDMQPPADACNTWRALYQGLNTLRVDLMQHIHLENNLLFPRALGAEV